MPKPHRKLRALAECQGKKVFKNYTHAAKAAKRSPNRSAYRCRFCHKWHIGHSLKDAGREILRDKLRRDEKRIARL